MTYQEARKAIRLISLQLNDDPVYVAEWQRVERNNASNKRKAAAVIESFKIPPAIEPRVINVDDELNPADFADRDAYVNAFILKEKVN